MTISRTDPFTIVEGKASGTAPLTSNQGKGLPAIANGATVEVRGDNAASLLLQSGDIITIDEILVVRPTGTTLVR